MDGGTLVCDASERIFGKRLKCSVFRRSFTTYLGDQKRAGKISQENFAKLDSMLLHSSEVARSYYDLPEMSDINGDAIDAMQNLTQPTLPRDHDH